MLRIFIVTLFLCLLVVPALARQPLYPIDPGGHTLDYARWVEDMNWFGSMVEIKGECDSACTMFLGAMHVCIWPQAWLGFHEVREVTRGQTYSSGTRSVQGTREIEAYYPLPIYNWVKKHKATSSGSVTYMTGIKAIELGVPNCQKVLK